MLNLNFPSSKAFTSKENFKETFTTNLELRFGKSVEESTKYEKYEVYFARETIWAAKQILKEEGVLNYTGIRRLTNLRRIHFDACKPYLDEFANKELADRIRQL